MEDPGKGFAQMLNSGISAMHAALVQKRKIDFLFEVIKKHHPDEVKEWEGLKKTWSEEAKEEVKKLFPAIEVNFKE